MKAIQEKTKQKDKNKDKDKEEEDDSMIESVSLNNPSSSNQKSSSRKTPTLKRLPTLSQLTDEQTGKTENVEFVIGDGIKIKVQWKYLHDKTYVPSADEEDPEKHEKVDLLFTTNYNNNNKEIKHKNIFEIKL